LQHQFSNQFSSYRKTSLDDLEAVYVALRDSTNGVARHEAKKLFTTYTDCFTGSELIDWFLTHVSIRTRNEAKEYAEELIREGYLEGIGSKTVKENTILRLPPSPPAKRNKRKDEEISLDSFKKLKVLGVGALAKVFLVKQKENSKLYAMKVIDKTHLAKNPDDFNNTLTEIRILQNSCPFLVNLKYSFQSQGTIYLIIDYLGGGDLSYHLTKLKRLPANVVQFISAELVLALEYLHTHNIMYRDLKPQNILFDTDGHVVLVDYNLSRDNVPDGRGHYDFVGSPSYTAPEVMNLEPYGKACDFWSLGCVIYHCLVGLTPFRSGGGDINILKQNVLKAEVTYPSFLFTNESKSLVSAFLVKNQDRRLKEFKRIKSHPFFAGIEWAKLPYKKIPSPIKISSKKTYLDKSVTKLSLDDSKEGERSEDDQKEPEKKFAKSIN